MTHLHADHEEPQPAWLRALVFSAGYATAVLIGRASRLPDTGFSVIWPAAGIGILWMRSSLETFRMLAGNWLVLACLAGALNYVTGNLALAGLFYAISNLVQALVTVLMMRRLMGDRALRTPTDLGLLLASCVIGMVPGSLIAVFGVWLTTPGLRGMALGTIGAEFLIRPLTGAVVVVALGMLLTERDVRADLGRDLRRLDLLPWVLLAGLLSVLTCTINMPPTTALLPLLIWAALRFSTPFTSLATIGAWMVVLVASRQAAGAFAAHSPHGRVIFSQSVALVLTCVALCVALFRDQRNQVIASLEALAQEGQARATQVSRSEQRYRQAFEDAPIGTVMVAQRQGRPHRIISANDEFQALLGMPLGAFLGMQFSDLVHVDDLPLLNALTADDRVGAPTADLRLRHQLGTYRSFRTSLSLVEPADGPPCYVAMIEDVTAQRQAQEALEFKALHDPLTGLANRALLADRLEHALAASTREQIPVGLLYLDLDGFKAVNDVGGHAVGDEVLVQVARRLTQYSRPGDTAARLGGDEFVVVCQAVTQTELVLVAERLLEALRTPFLVAGTAYTIDASAGAVCAIGGGAQTARDMLKRADAAMYEAKRSGKGRIELALASR